MTISNVTNAVYDPFQIPHFTLNPSTSGTIYVDNGKSTLYLHGWLLWAVWSILGLIQVISLRYLKPTYTKILPIKNLNMFLHITSGLAILGVTIAMSIEAIKFYLWKLRWNECLHSAFGLFVLFAVSAVVLLGFISWLSLTFRESLMCCRKLKVHLLHSYLGYALLIVSQIATLLGVIRYNDETSDGTLGYANLSIFLGTWAVLEAYYRLKHSRRIHTSQDEITTFLSLKEFNLKLKQSHRLVVLDNFVFNLENYVSNHPGGERLLTSNIGRDVSKYFYGGYSMKKG